MHTIHMETPIDKKTSWPLKPGKYLTNPLPEKIFEVAGGGGDHEKINNIHDQQNTY